MVNIVSRKTLQGAEKYGSCCDCGKGTDEKEIYKIEFGRKNNQSSSGISSISICWDCLVNLGDMIYDMYQDECVTEE